MAQVSGRKSCFQIQFSMDILQWDFQERCAQMQLIRNQPH